MKNPLTKLTMYDMLTMLVAGFLWCHLFWSGTLEEQCESVLFWVVCYIVGLIYHRLLDAVAGKCKCLRNNPKWIEKAYDKIKGEHPGKLEEDFSMANYYGAYYRLMQNNCLNNIPVLEAQVALLRNLVLISVVYFIKELLPEGAWQMIKNWLECHWGISVLWGIALVGVILVWRFTQKKIHELVWEGSCFIQDKGVEKKNGL